MQFNKISRNFNLTYAVNFSFSSLAEATKNAKPENLHKKNEKRIKLNSNKKKINKNLKTPNISQENLNNLVDDFVICIFINLK